MSVSNCQTDSSGGDRKLFVVLLEWCHIPIFQMLVHSSVAHMNVHATILFLMENLEWHKNLHETERDDSPINHNTIKWVVLTLLTQFGQHWIAKAWCTRFYSMRLCLHIQQIWHLIYMTCDGVCMLARQSRHKMDHFNRIIVWKWIEFSIDHIFYVCWLPFCLFR